MEPEADYCAKPTRRNKSWKRGSVRSGSKAGSTLREVRIARCSEYGMVLTPQDEADLVAFLSAL